MGITMRSFHGNLYQRGKVVLEDVRGTMRIPDPLLSSRLHTRSWCGDFQLPSGRSAQAGDRYELRLSDGRIGQLLVKRSAVSAPGPVNVEFLGCGPLQRPSVS